MNQLEHKDTLRTLYHVIKAHVCSVPIVSSFMSWQRYEVPQCLVHIWPATGNDDINQWSILVNLAIWRQSVFLVGKNKQHVQLFHHQRPEQVRQKRAPNACLLNLGLYFTEVIHVTNSDFPWCMSSSEYSVKFQVVVEHVNIQTSTPAFLRFIYTADLPPLK